MKHYYRRCNLILTVFMLVSLLLINFSIGCDDNPYKTFNQEKGVGHFSFEYLKEYKLSTRGSDQDTTSVILERQYKKLEYSTLLNFLIVRPSILYYDVNSGIDYSLRIAQNSIDFQFLSTINTVVDGIEAKGFIYACNTGVPTDWPGGKSRPIIVRIIVFEYGDLIWNAEISSLDTTDEADAVDLERLLKSFKFLD
jgi:hypothetical protein